MIGTSLSHYRITEKLGQGGMGEVYRAEDTNLSRQVAIKVLHDEFAHDAERLARFEREAKLLASLNHPNIAPIYGLEEHEGKRFLVLELVEGQTLSERLKKGRIPLDETLDICRQIAEGLEAAHDKGIIHRDLKPSNVKVTPEGKVKILDFGLAKAFYEQAAPVDPSRSPTITEQMTAPGVILGTAAYMSPEQARGKPVDKRGDIWAFGCIVYECLTGKRAFPGETITETLAAVIRGEADWNLLPPGTSENMRNVFRRCLQKDPRLRLHDIADARLEIEESLAAEHSGPAAAGAVSLSDAQRPKSRREAIAWTLVAILGVALSGLVTAFLRRSPVSAPMVSFNVLPPEGTELQLYLALSHDGTHLAFTARAADGLDRLYVRPLESGKSKSILGTEGALQPFWSPDGHSLGFFAQGKLKRVEIDGGAPQAICNVPELRGATWSRDGVILFGTGGAYGLHRVGASGGTPELVSQPDATRGETSHRWPCFLPNGRSFLYVALSAQGGSISVGSLDGKKPVRLIDVLSAPTYVASGYLLFVRDGALRAQQFEAVAARLLGEAVTLAEPVQLDINMWGGAPVSAGGAVLAYRSGEIDATQFTWLDREGREQGAVGPPGDYGSPALSPDGGRLVAGVRGSRQLAMVDLGTGAFMPFTFKPEMVNAASWSPDGRSIAYDSNRNGMFDIFQVPAGGGGAEETLVHGGATNWCDGFSPDGRFLLYESSDPKTQYDLWIVPLSGDRKPQVFLRTDATETHASFSPNGRWVAYTSDASGRAEVYVRAFPSGDGPWQVSTKGGDQAQWRRDGCELFYLSPDRRMMAVAVNGESAAFKAFAPKALFRARVRTPGIVAIRNDYVVSPDGQRFLINKPVEDPTKATITVVVNWAAGMKK